MLYWGLHAQIEHYLLRGKHLHIPFFSTVREGLDSLQFDYTYFRHVLSERQHGPNLI